MTKLILKLFFLLPSWLLKIVTMRKKILVNGQILDYQTQILLVLQSLQPDNFDLTESAADLRIKLDGRQDSLPNIKLSGSQVTFCDHTIYADNIELTIREYTPEQQAHVSPILYFHGGGYVIGTIETHHQWLRLLASSMQSTIFSLEYRLSPENKFPASLEDANLALEWIASTTDHPVSAISLCGDSAGAHLAASLSTYRSMKGLEAPHSQCLIYPMTDPSCSSKSQNDFATGYFLTREAMLWFWEQFRESQENLLDPCFNLLQEHAHPLPKTLLITAGFDPLSDEGEEYARKIFASGNELDHIHYPHLIHGFVNMTVLRAAKEASLDFIKTYKAYFSK